MSRWYVVHTQPRAEGKALWHLKNQNFPCFLPHVFDIRQHARKAKPVLVPLFPRYLFVRFNLTLTRWRAINGTRGVVMLLANGPHPIPLPHGIIEALIAKCDYRSITSLAALDLFTNGCNVRIKTGPFKGQLAKVTEHLTTTEHGRDRVSVLLTLLGAQTELRLGSHEIEAA